MKIKRKIVSIDPEKCDGCGQCAEACADGAIELFNGKAQLVAERYCDGLAACLGECPQGAISMIEREADLFDAEAVEEHISLKTKHKTQITTHKPGSEMPCGCPTTQLETFNAVADTSAQREAGIRQRSMLTHWPVQIRLVPPGAPFLKNANLLVVSDCVPVAYPNFQEDLVKGRVVMMGCPKFDDINEYIGKFAQIFKTAHVKSVTVAIMEVPCCSKMPMIVKKAMEMAEVAIPYEVLIVSARGDIIKRTPFPSQASRRI